MDNAAVSVAILAVGLVIVGLTIMLSGDSIPLPYPTNVRANPTHMKHIREIEKRDEEKKREEEKREEEKKKEEEKYKARKKEVEELKGSVPWDEHRKWTKFFNSLSRFNLYDKDMEDIPVVVFLDVDGTITKLPGQHPDSLFSKAEYYESAGFNDEIMKTLYEDKQSHKRVKEFLHFLQEHPRYEPVIVSLNHRSVIKHILEKHFGCDSEVFLKHGFTRDDAFGSPRGGTAGPTNNGISGSLNGSQGPFLKTKAQFMQRFTMERVTNPRLFVSPCLFFDDDRENLKSAQCTTPCFDCIDCSGGMWIGKMLKHHWFDNNF